MGSMVTDFVLMVSVNYICSMVMGDCCGQDSSASGMVSFVDAAANGKDQ